MKSPYFRKEIYTIEDVLSKVIQYTKGEQKIRVNFNGDLISMNSQRYRLFKEKGVKCTSCGIEGKFFAKERVLVGGNVNTYHFNLYAINADGEEVLMTKDHIIPKSLGGANNINNYQTMCTYCNSIKDNKLICEEGE